MQFQFSISSFNLNEYKKKQDKHIRPIIKTDTPTPSTCKPIQQHTTTTPPIRAIIDAPSNVVRRYRSRARATIKNVEKVKVVGCIPPFLFFESGNWRKRRAGAVNRKHDGEQLTPSTTSSTLYHLTYYTAL